MAVVGTAGHVDHGKSSLVKALTGIDPDRLKEEKVREMTIDLGFAWMTLPSGMEVSIIDVPGHEKFIRNMLAGAGGVDLALMVIAADEGPMPQTQEHLDILRFLNVSKMVVAITKVDLVDEDWLQLIREDVQELLNRTGYGTAPVVTVSSRTGYGLDRLIHTLDEMLKAVPPAPDVGRPRLPIDRAFTMVGFGTVVTGTLTGGALMVGQEVEIVPGEIRARIRGLQSHRRRVEVARPGTRVAVNLAGVEVGELRRGMVISIPGAVSATQKALARIVVSEACPVELTSGMELDFFSGTAESRVRLRFLDVPSAGPGANALVEVHIAQPVALQMGDKFILRRPSPSLTVAGGSILSPRALGRLRRSELVKRLHALQGSSLEAKVTSLLPPRGAILKEDLEQLLDAPREEVQRAVERLAAEDKVVKLGDDQAPWLMEAGVWARLVDTMTDILRQYHRENPMRPGMSKEELRSRLKLDPKLAGAVVSLAQKHGVVVEQAGLVRLADHTIKLNPVQEEKLQRFVQALLATPFMPPSPGDFEVDRELLGVLRNSGEVIEVAEGIAFHRDALQEAVKIAMDAIDSKGSVTIADLRDLLGTTRKYALALLEYMDRVKLTVRVGDVRVRR